MGIKRVAAVGDIHAPFQDNKAVAKVYSLIAAEKTDVIIQMGDCYDRFSFGRFARSQDVLTPKHEIESARAFMESFWRQMKKLHPKARLIQIRGNHCDRIIKQTMERFPEIYSLVQKADSDLFKFKGVETIQDSRSELEIDGVIYTHGWYTKLGDHARFFLKPVVRAHSHRGGTHFFNAGGHTIWELDCGFLADQKQRALQYGPTMSTYWTLGLGRIDENGPRFIPLQTKISKSK